LIENVQKTTGILQRGNAMVQWTKINYCTDNKANNKNHVTLRVRLSFHTIGLVILSFDEDTGKKR